ncbi:hypothetical protein [Rhizobium leguminosarum]|uniref:hypothetical protein n=1 Tax=Rhizobium leguminosarum TaxID=384 RepID=UPI0014412D58|nr:hypothetical protein [Rhizobium leguminosarum]MBY5863193.1 hypothetical protein [Rhizobium leguminosarum]NKM04073.1 hypothetical protein [Rhizobium leguminosarum bv. viciae]
MTSMDPSSKIKVLRQLARTSGEGAAAALDREAHKILAVLETDVTYGALRSQIELLDTFAFRVPDLAVEGMTRFLSRLETIKLARDRKSDFADTYETPAQLAVAALELLSRLRYYRTKEILSIAMAAESSNVDTVRKAATDVLKRIAEFDMDVFYSGDKRAGLGAAPQKEVIDFLEADVQLDHHFAAAVSLCSALLSPNMQGTSWDYASVVWKSSAVPATTEVKEMRARTLSYLKEIYDLKCDVASKRQLINAMFEASRLPNHGTYPDDIIEMISDNTTDILSFLEQRLAGEPFPVIQKIEHDAYWRYYHAPTDAVREAALRIRDRVDAADEYKIYRDLVGFEGIFERWEDRRLSGADFREVGEYRSRKALEYALSIDNSNWQSWRERILRFCETESEDLATFPKFYEFLEKVAVHHPQIALDLLKESPAAIARFTIPLLRGLWAGQLRAETRDLMWGWISRGEHLLAIAKLFWSNDDVDEDVLGFLLDRLAEVGNYAGFRLLIGAAASNYSKFPSLVASVILPAIKVLSKVGDSLWIHEIWYSDDARRMLSELDADARQIVLNGLKALDDVDFHAEEVLIPLAKNDPAQVMMFFRARIDVEDSQPEGAGYRAIPFSFHQLHNVLEQSPELMVDIVFSWFSEPIEFFQHRGGHLLKSIFPSFPAAFSKKLFKMVETGARERIEFVLEVLKNYEGEQFLYEICREILLHISTDDPELLTSVSVVLSNTGVVHGEYGFAIACEQKASAITPWLSDSKPEIRDFADRLIQDLKRTAEAERRRAKEDITLRKHTYGARGTADDLEENE